MKLLSKDFWKQIREILLVTYEGYTKAILLVLFLFCIYIIINALQIPFDVTNPQLFIEWANKQGPNFALTVFLINWLVIFIPFLPNDPIHIAAGLVMPWWQAFLLIHFCSILGWSMNYYLGKHLGSKFVYGLLGEKHVKNLEEILSKTKKQHFIFLAWTPGVSYDIVGYIAGMTKASYSSYLLGAAVGTIPTTLLSITYGTLTQHYWWVAPLALSINMLSIVGLSGILIYKGRGFFSKTPSNK